MKIVNCCDSLCCMIDDDWLVDWMDWTLTLIQTIMNDQVPERKMKVREDLYGGNEAASAHFVKDMGLIFSNSRNNNTNKQSRVSDRRHTAFYFDFESFH